MSIRSSRHLIPGLAAAAALTLALGCGDKKEGGAVKEQKAEVKGPAASGAKVAAEPAAPVTLPTEVEVIALDQGDSKIPATIEAPKGSTTFNDDPTSIRVSFTAPKQPGQLRPVTLFGVQVRAGNEFNVKLGELAAQLKENKYGVTNTILESSEQLLSWTAVAPESPTASYNFQMLVDLGGKPWLCSSGVGGGWTQEQMQRQIAACKTLKAK